MPGHKEGSVSREMGPEPGLGLSVLTKSGLPSNALWLVQDPPLATPPGSFPGRQEWNSELWPPVFPVEMVDSGRGQEFRALGASIPTGEPPGEKRKYPVRGRGGRGCWGGENSLVCSLKLLFQETQAYGGGWCGGRVWVVCALAFAFCVVECIFFFLTGSCAHLVLRALRLESEAFPWHPEKSSPLQWWFWSFQ